ncbi:alanine--tRNA ligase [Candidatus Tisiphia endosymbiont of Temnostethus pusillus]|uniref:alanine--tRNA ligase n=1 Tax=Candidatus Tisiphia endosymbiont of Temnostethus pusillus TaxID=3139335 RepID=UPI0035C8C8E4
MTKLTTEEIRSKFISYFVANNHIHVPASSLIPHNDPSLMFVNSGMVQFKNVFTGQETRNYQRATTSQKSLRAGGKHNDLENVGYTARHHTFFEMLGNFSFGDYFKEQAIYYAWNLLTKEFAIAKEKLYVTVYHTDEEAASYWKKIANLSDDRIIKIATNDNFWSMGDTGPCGPCSEIFYDHGEKIPGGLPGTKDQDGDRYIEIWNMVFMQFEQLDSNTRIALPKQSVDTGMGLERISAVLQNVYDNYDIDLFKEIIAYTESIVKVKVEGEAKFSYRVIADHLRACAFLISDGVMPSNEGRGYVLRRIMRRSMRHAHILGSSEPLMYRLLAKLVDLMGATYPELKRAEAFTRSILEQEELRFKATLERGLKLLDDETQHLSKNSELSGEIAFKLYDTYGFPLDLTEDILKGKQISVDLDSFNNKMQEQKERARKAWLGSNESQIDQIWFDIKGEFGSTEFFGYSLDKAEGKILALIKDNKLVNNIETSEEQFILISNQTPFYGESGGQMGDIGYIKSTNSKIRVVDTVKYLGSIIAHICILQEGTSIKVGDSADFAIDVKYRNNLRIHHSATHILHAVLHQVLGKHVTQKGSLVAYDRLRFDISHMAALTTEEIILIEDKVNQIITDNSKVTTTLMSTDEAIKAGAMALFGEKYDSEVRVVAMGNPLELNSLELCGGTHVNRTGDIGMFKITSDSSVAAGVRRIEAVCGEFVLKLIRQNDTVIENISSTLKIGKNEIIDKVNSLIASKKQLEDKLVDLQVSMLDLNIEQIAKESVSISDIYSNDLKNWNVKQGESERSVQLVREHANAPKFCEANSSKQKSIQFIYKIVKNIDSKILRLSAQRIADKSDNLVIVYIGMPDLQGKLSITIAVSKKITNKIHAGNLAKEISIFLGGSGGGGQANIAQAGGTDVSKIEKLPDMIRELLSKF